MEYTIVHEMAHLIEPTHNERFVALLDLHFYLINVHSKRLEIVHTPPACHHCHRPAIWHLAVV
nr:YgjP-like metallopeptidase domain-containing protein [Halomonas llamarensis]